MASIAAILADHQEIEKKHAAKINDLQTFHVSTSTEKLTCYARLAHKFPSRPLLDTGANISLIKESFFRSLPATFRNLQKSNIRVQSASGNALIVLGTSILPIKVGTQNSSHSFVIVKELKHPCILGLDWMRKNSANINLARNVMTIGHEDIDLLGLSDFMSQGRLAQSISVKPQTTSFIYIEPKSNYVDPDIFYQVSSGTSKLVANEPGLYLLNTISKVHKNDLIPAILINDTGKHFHLTKGNVLATLLPSHQSDFEVQEITSTPHSIDLQKDFDPKFSVQSLKLENPDITPQQRQQLIALIQEFDDIFAKHAYDIGKADVEVSIPLKDNNPIAQRPFRIPLSLQQDVRDQISQMLHYDIIKPTHSPWSFSLVTVKKKCGATRVCVDLRKLNLITEAFTFPMTNFDTCLGNLANAKYFSSLDFNQGFLNLKVSEPDQDILTFVCDEGKFSYQRLPFGWKNSPGIFCEFVSKILQPHRTYATAWMDDILCWSKSVEDHFKHLRALFQCIRDANVKLKLPKCNFFRLKLKYVGYIISNKGASPDPDKISAIKDMTPPTNISGVRSFLGAIGFYRRFFPDFAKIARPLTELTHKNAKFLWNDDRQKAFDTLKNHLISDHVLAFPDASKPFELYCDSSMDCIGSCLVQRDENNDPRPLYYISHSLDKSKRKWGITEKEAYAIVYSLQKLKPIVYGIPLVIYTDHNACCALQSGNLANAKLQRWALMISDYQATIKYLPGNKNHLADFLSRYASRSHTSCNLINTDIVPPTPSRARRDSLASDSDTDLSSEDDGPQPLTSVTTSDIITLQREDPEASNLINLLQTDPDHDKARFFALHEDTLYFFSDAGHSRLVLPKSIIPQVIKEAHEGFLSSHLGIRKTYATLNRLYYYKGLHAAVKRYINSCHTCSSTNTRAQRIPIQEFPIPPFPFHTVAIDICGHFPQSSSGNRYVITAIDMLTSYIEATTSPDKSASSVATFLIDEIIPRHSTPTVLISDNGTEFVNDIIRYLTDSLKIHHIRSSTHHPQSNGRLERSHRLLTDTMIKLSQESPEHWDKAVKNYVGAHNCSTNYTGFSPFYLIYHRLPTYPLDTLLKPRDIYYGESFGPQLVEKMHRIFKIVRKQIKKETKQNRVRHNKRTSYDILEVGDVVYVKNKTTTSKLSPRWHPEPYIIVKQNGRHSFSVQNPLTNRVSRVFQDSLRKISPSDAWLRPTPVSEPTADRRPRRRTRNVASSSPSSGENSDSASDSDASAIVPSARTHTPVNIPSPNRQQSQNRSNTRSSTYSNPLYVPDPIFHPNLTVAAQTPTQPTYDPPDPVFYPNLPLTPLTPPRHTYSGPPDPVHMPTQYSPSSPIPTRSNVQARPDPVHMPTQTPPSNKKRRLSISSDDGFMDHDAAEGDNKKSRLFSVKSRKSPFSSIMAMFNTNNKSSGNILDV